MGNGRTPEANITRAKGLRVLKKSVKDPGAAQRFEDAAIRLEKAAAKKLLAVGKTVKRKPSKAGRVLG